MKTLLKAILLVIIITGVFPLRAYAQHAVIRGSILDEHKLPLPGANIVWMGSLDSDRVIGTSSDINGDFILRPVAIGKQSIRVTYMGFVTRIVEVDAKFDEIVEVEVILKAGVVSLDEVVVVGERLAGQAKALNLQKTNNNITNVISIDQISKFADSNIGDALKRIPGVAMHQDRGEASVIILRGLAPEYTNVMVNGERIASSFDNNRGVAVDNLPADMVQTVELSKTMTPDMDGDATAGTVNLITRSAPHKRTFSLTMNSGRYQIENKPVWTGALILGDRFFGGKFGIITSASYDRKDYGAHSVFTDWRLTGQDDSYYLEDFNIERYLVERTRKNVTTSLDYKVNSSSSIKFKGSYSNKLDRENRFRQRHRNLRVPSADGTVSNVEYRFDTKVGIDGEPQRKQITNVYSAKLDGEHLLWRKLTLDWSGSYGRSDRSYTDRDFLWAQPSLNVIPDISDPRHPVLNFVDPSRALDITKVRLRELSEDRFRNEETDYRARLNIEIPITVGNQGGAIKFGGVVKHKNKEVTNFQELFLPLGANWANWANLGQHETFDPSVDNFLAGDYRFSLPVIQPAYGSGLDLRDSTLFTVNVPIANFGDDNYDAIESEQSGYLMLTQSLGSKLTAITGVRFENRVNEFVGWEFNNGSKLGVNSLRSKENYVSVLPSLTLKYDLNQSTVLRAAWTNTVIRPDFNDLAPRKSFNFEDQRMSEGNPDLEPAKSRNFDLIAEKYFQSIGQISLGVFRKDIRDMILTVERRFPVGALFEKYGALWDRYTQPQNAGDAWLIGFEFAFQRRLDFLPGFLGNLSGYFNYSRTKSEVDGLAIVGREDEKLPLEGTADESLNASLTYETKKFVLTGSLHHTGANILFYGEHSSDLDAWYDAQTFVDVSSSYRVSRTFSIFAEGKNLTNQPLRHYTGSDPDFARRAEYYGRIVNIGFRVNR